ncbi:MAG: tetraacyldisaccharide 4'-kinase [Pirellulales bacterium]|nr:tetraacyldisaccharide 4'-kinase [Pirellulales bacterium]
MFTVLTFRDLISGRRRGPVAGVLRGLLRLAEGPYTWEVRRRNQAFDTGRRTAEHVGVPVVSVGNLTLGGTGKTPLVVWLAQWFCRRGVRVALISRGYRASPGELNDEGRELEQKLPDVPHLQNPDRVAAAQKAVQELGAEVILLDDGFQHRRLARDLDIVLIDALEPFGFEHVFPRGTLREPLDEIRRAHIVVLSRADMVCEAERMRIRRIVERYAPSIAWASCNHVPQSLLSSGGAMQPIEALVGQRVAAFCGIGNPAGFRHTLTQCGCEVAVWREFPDHHSYSAADLVELAHWTSTSDASLAVCTHKDLVKIAADSLGGKPLRAVRVGMELMEGRCEIELQLSTLLEGRKLPTRISA